MFTYTSVHHILFFIQILYQNGTYRGIFKARTFQYHLEIFMKFAELINKLVTRSTDVQKQVLTNLYFTCVYRIHTYFQQPLPDRLESIAHPYMTTFYKILEDRSRICSNPETTNPFILGEFYESELD